MYNENITNEIDKLIEDLEPALIQDANDEYCKCDEPKLQYCCNVMIEHKTHLSPPVACHSKIRSEIKIDVQIEKVCAGAIIISGMVHKVLHYKARLKDGTINSCYKKCFDIPFNCFINTCEANEDDEYEVIGHDILCTYAIPNHINSGCNKPKKNNCLHIEKIFIKICVMKK